MNNFSSNFAILFPLGSCLYIALRLNDGQADSKEGGWVRSLLYTIASLLITFSIVGILFRFGPISLIWLIAAAFLGLLIWLKRRAINRLLLLQSFTSVSTDVARERMAVDFVEHNRWFVASRAKRFRRALAAGMKWPEAMEKAGIAKTTSEIFSCRYMAAFAPEGDRGVPASLDPFGIQAEIERLLGRLMVIPWLTLGGTIVVLVMWLIVPTLRQMMAEFDTEIPQSMQTFITFNDSMGSLLATLCFLLSIAFGLIALIWIFPGLVLYHPFRWVARRYFGALALVSLAQSVRRQADFPQACKSAAEILPMRFIGKRMEASASLCLQGVSPDQALARTELLSAQEASLLSAAVETRSFPWALEQVAISSTERMLAFYSIAVQLLIVFLVLFLAVFFGWLAIGVIEVLSVMIEHLARV